MKMENGTKLKKKKIIELVLKLGCSVVVSLIIVVGIILLINYSNQKRYNEKILLGDEYLNDKDYENAILAYSDAINIYPNKLQVYISLSEVYVKKEDYEAAKKVLASASLNSMKVEEKTKIEEKITSIQKIEDEVKKKAEAERLAAEEAQREVEQLAEEEASRIVEWNSGLIDNVSQQIANHYTELWNPDGTYSCSTSAGETIVKDDKIQYTLRYAMSEEKAQQIQTNGGMVSANTLVTMAYVDKATGKAYDADNYSEHWFVEF